MTRYVIDAGVLIHLATNDGKVAKQHELLAPTLIRSQTLSLLHQAVGRGELTDEVARERLERIWEIKLRLLGDAVLRRNAWRIAGEMGWDETYTAEYVALTKLQGDAFVTLDAKLAKSLKGVVGIATVDALRM